MRAPKRGGRKARPYNCFAPSLAGPEGAQYTSPDRSPVGWGEVGHHGFAPRQCGQNESCPWERGRLARIIRECHPASICVRRGRPPCLPWVYVRPG